MLNIPLSFFLDTGAQYRFAPLYIDNEAALPKDPLSLPPSLRDAIDKIAEVKKELPRESLEKIQTMFKKKKDHLAHFCWTGVETLPYIKYRFGDRQWTLPKNKQKVRVNGLWICLETNTSAQDRNKSLGVQYDRGCFYQKNHMTEQEQKDFLESKLRGIAIQRECPYIQLAEKKSQKLELSELDISIELIVKEPNREEPVDVCLVLDLGNTRTAGIIVDGLQDSSIDLSKSQDTFKILRLKPVPHSGDYDSVSDVEAGIAPSHFILHELDTQTYREDSDDYERPSVLINDMKSVRIEKRGGFLGFGGKKIVVGEVIQRIPQMFTRMSPVLIGDAVTQQFESNYALGMIRRGANVQQSSPKRYYWDESKGKENWNMLLNEWDPAYVADIQNARYLPRLQGEMLRYISEDGSIIDWNKELTVERPLAYPTSPIYPKECTLTWFLLHILERAYMQLNSPAEDKDERFITRRIRKVLITYPSGWSRNEIELYRRRCQEALDIFTEANIYHGIKSEQRLELVGSESTPDEAVAGQLPFVFSEIERYRGQTAKEWISLVGKKRGDKSSVRIMNFDIGGGTTDISIVEYEDLVKKGALLNEKDLQTTLLFKDGQSIAGDNLVKRIIEKIILPCIANCVPDRKKYPMFCLKVFSDNCNYQEEVARSNVVKNCLIPLATYCLEKINSAEPFSAQMVNINRNNWIELQKIIGADSIPGDPVSYSNTIFSFRDIDINQMIDDIFSSLLKNCAIYAAAYDIDLLIFSGKTSELPYIRTIAQKFIPIEDERLIFAREYKPGKWYPFLDSKGHIKDAKTVTAIGAALYFALSNNYIPHWSIKSNTAVHNSYEWGEMSAIQLYDKVFMGQKLTEVEVEDVQPNTIIGRRLNKRSEPEPVYKFVCKTKNNSRVKIKLLRDKSEFGEEALKLEEVYDPGKDQDVTSDYELKLWPCNDASGFQYWQDSGQLDYYEENDSE